MAHRACCHTHANYQKVSLRTLIEGGLSLWGWLARLCVHICVCQCGGHCLVSVFYCVWMGGTKAAMSRSLEFNDVCGKVCVHVCVCANQEEVCPWSKPFEVLRIWAGYGGQDTHRERGKEGKGGSSIPLT